MARHGINFFTLGLQFVTLIVTLVWGISARAQGDAVVMEDGGRLLGEIKSLDRGILRFETDATDTIDIEWSHVSFLTSGQSFLVTLSDGRQVFGSWVDSENETVLRLDIGGATLDLPLLLIVRMTPIEGRLLDRIAMSVDLGYNATKANDLTQTDFSFDFSYRSEERLITTNLDASRSSSGDEPTSIRTNNAFSYRRFIGDRKWDPQGFGTIERNDELGLDRRVTMGGGMSRWLKDTNSSRINFLGGLVVSKENESGAVESDNSVEALVGIDLDWFRYDSPELDVAMRLAVHERLSGTSRTRGDIDIDLRWELVNDFFWGFSIYYSFNIEPTGPDASREDYGIVTSIGWSF